MQRRTPLAIQHVGFAPRQVFGLAPIDHDHFQSSRFEHPVQRQPMALGQPLAQGIQLTPRHGSKYFGRPTRNREAGLGPHVHPLAAHVNKRGRRIQTRQVAH